MHCGTTVQTAASTGEVKHGVRTTPPVGVNILNFVFRGQADIEKRWVWQPWSNLLPEHDTYIGKTFEFMVFLYDTSGDWTVSDGTLIYVFTPVEMDKMRGGEYKPSTLPLGARVEAISKARQKGIFYDALSIKAKDFKWVEFNRYVSGGEEGWQGMAYNVQNLDRPVFDRSREPYHEVYLHVWFQTLSNQLLYDRFGRIHWE